MRNIRIPQVFTLIQNITVRGGAKGGDKRWSKNLHRIRVFLADSITFYVYLI